jgi:hypothetical protein
MTDTKTPNPGSKEAQELGCTCPVVDNHYGNGVPSKDGPLFWYYEDCPVHTKKKKP